MYTTIKTAPAAEPIDTTTTKTMLRVDYSADDTLIAFWISAARQHAEEISGLVGITTTYQTWLDCWPGNGIVLLPRRPVQTISSVKYYTADGTLTTISASNYVLDTMAAKPALLPAYGYSWPTDLRERDAIVIEYVAGQGASYTAVDATYRNKIMGLVSVWYEARDGMTYEQQTRLNNLEWALRQDGY